MPWKETTTMQQKAEFIHEWKSGLYSISELCRAFEISRSTAYRLIKRFQNESYDGLLRLSKAPVKHPNQTPQDIELAIIDLRKKHKRWGARKIWKLLQHDFPLDHIPSIVTVNNIMKRNGLILPRKSIRRVKPVYPIFDPKECNETWSADYKGKFRMRNSRYCHPLTIADSKSRFLFTAKGHYHERYKLAKQEFSRVFMTYGIPKQIHTDNGAPFGSVLAIQRFTKLSYWFIELGIEPVFSDPGKPQQNGRHERMHRDLKAACAKPPAYNLRSQQRKLNQFVKEYNELRPHDALGLETPASKHQFSMRKFNPKIKQYDYEEHLIPRYVSLNGSIRWRTHYWIYIARGLSGKHVGLEELENGIWRVYYRAVFLGYFDETHLNMEHKHIRLTQFIV